jgi:branched-chain amino acid transport system substrate-binding protein
MVRIGLFGAVVTGAVTALAPLQGIAADKVKIGFVTTLSGPASLNGQHMNDGFYLAVDELNGKIGGLPRSARTTTRPSPTSPSR